MRLRPYFSILLVFTAAIGFSYACAEEVKDTQKQKTVKVARLVVNGELPESAQQSGLLGEFKPNLRQLIERLDKAAADEKITSVILRLQNPQIGRGKLAELRAAVKRLRANGKKVYAQMEMVTAQDYLLACACDKIIMPESGTLIVTGVHAEVAFFKDLLENIGAQADIVQVGDYKGAAEPYTRDSMSDEFRAQYELLVDDLYNHLIETIALERELNSDKVRDLIDVGMLTPKEALAVGLIDKIMYDNQFISYLEESSQADRLVMIDDYGKEKLEADFSGLMGMVKMMEMLMGGSSKKSSSRHNKIAIVYASGPIISGESEIGLFGSQTAGSDTIVKAIQTAEDHSRVVATVLRVDSPGGSAIASDQIWNAVVTAKKPIVASMGDLAASGGYYISMGCDRIIAEPETLTGSIGVVGGKIALGGLMDKIGIHTETISRGKNSSIMSAQAPFTESEREVWIKMMQETYRQFVDKAAKGRQMEPQKMESLAGGRIWTGRLAKEKGLVDEIGSLQEAIDAAKQLAGLEADDKVELIILPKPKSFMDQLMEGSMIRVPWGQNVDAVMSGASILLDELKLVNRLFSEPSVLILPYHVHVR